MATQSTNHLSNRRNAALLRLLMFPLALLASPSVSAAVIDFELTPSGVIPTDDMQLTAPYVQGGLSISFGFDIDPLINPGVDLDAKFEEIGLGPGETPLTGGFLGSSGPDTPDPGFGFPAQLGSWFLRGPVGASDFGLMVITYSGGPIVTAASGEIWDIDGNPPQGSTPGFTEEYTVRAYDSGNNLLATQVSPLGVLDTLDPASLDGQPWVFSFSGLSAGIAQITIDFTGTKTTGIGLAFNNFNPTAAIPEPAAWLLAMFAFAVLSSFKCRRTHRLKLAC